MTRIALNGLGRIGKLVLRRLMDTSPEIDVVLINDISGDLSQHALLMEFDSIHGHWPTPVEASDDGLRIAGKDIPLRSERDPAALGLQNYNIDVMVDCTGVFKSKAKLQPYFDQSVPRVLVSAPVKDEGALNIVYGVNHHLYDGSQTIVTAASCTTNCLAPVIKVIKETFGLRRGSFTTVHDVTNTQTIADRAHKDPRRARSALMNMIPTTTGSAKAIIDIYPELAGKLMGHAIRIPLLNASLTDCAFELERATTTEAVNAAFEEAAQGELEGILGYEERPLVSTDYLNDDRSSIIDALSTVVIDGTHAKIYAWYDNEWGYACRMVDLIRMMIK